MVTPTSYKILRDLWARLSFLRESFCAFLCGLFSS